MRWRAALGATLVLVGAVVMPAAPPAAAAPAEADIVAGFLEPDPANHSRVVIHGVGFKRVGVYGVTINGTPKRAVSISTQIQSPNRHRRPAATELVQTPNLRTSALLDYVLWKHSGTTDSVTAAALHLLAWHLASQNVGNPSLAVVGPTDPAWGPPGSAFPGIAFYTLPSDATGAPVLTDEVDLGDLIETAAKSLVTDSAPFLGPWTIDLSLIWGSHEGKIMVRTAGNVGVPGVTVNLNSLDSNVPSSVVTDSNGDATFTFNPVLDVTTVTASAQAPGVHTEWDVQGDPTTSGYQRIAVGASATISDSFTIAQPQISTFAKDAVDGDKTIGAGGSIIDTLQYQNLVPGTTYTSRVTWFFQDTAEASSLTATKTFVAGPTGSGNVDVGPVVTGPSELGRSLVAYEFLYAGANTNGFPEVIHADINDGDQTVTVQPLFLITDARDTYDGDKIAYAGASLMDTVAYIGLASGTKYTARVEWHVTDGTNSLGSTGLTTTKTFFADPSGFGTVDVGPVTLTGAEVGVSVVAFERIYVGDATTGIPIGTHEAADDPSQTVGVLPPNVLTIARDVEDGDRVVEALGEIADQIVFANLHPGLVHTARLEWHYTDGAIDLGPTGFGLTKTFTPSAPTGVVDMGPMRAPGNVSGQKIVAYERVYLGPTPTGTPVLAHEVPSSPGQTLLILEQTISTVATQGTLAGVAIPGDKEIPIGPGATVVDTVTVDLAPGTPVQLVGHLVRYTDGECTDALITVTATAIVSANHTVTVVHSVPEAPGEYVAYVVVNNQAGSELVQHQDCLASSQRVTVVGDDLPETR